MPTLFFNLTVLCTHTEEHTDRCTVESLATSYLAVLTFPVEYLDLFTVGGHSQLTAFVAKETHVQDFIAVAYQLMKRVR